MDAAPHLVQYGIADHVGDKGTEYGLGDCSRLVGDTGHGCGDDEHVSIKHSAIL